MMKKPKGQVAARIEADIKSRDEIAREHMLKNVVLPHHYARFKIEPIRFCVENQLNPLQSKVIKYVCRYDAKNGLEDLYKAKRNIEMLIEHYKGNPDWWKAPGSAVSKDPA